MPRTFTNPIVEVLKELGVMFVNPPEGLPGVLFDENGAPLGLQGEGGDPTLFPGAGSGANLSATRDATTVTVISDTGTDAMIPAADATDAGIMSSAQAVKLAGIEAGATADMTPAEIIAAVDSLLGTDWKLGNAVDIIAAIDGAIGTDWRTGGGGGATNLAATLAPTQITITSDTGTDAVIPAADGTNAGLMLPAEKSKLSGIAPGATANQTDAFLRSRANHTDQQAASTISDFSAAADARIAAAVAGSVVDAFAALVTQIEAEAGTSAEIRNWSPLRVAQAIAALAVGGGAITVQDEGAPLASGATTLNFTGAGVTASGAGATKTIDIPGAGTATITVKENGAEVSAVVTILDFLGADFDVTEAPSGEVNIVISGAIARLDSPTFTGTPAAPTAAPGTNTTQLSTTAFVQAAIASLIDASPGALDTLNELAAALGDDPNFATTVTNALAAKAPLASPALTGTPTAPTAAPGTNTTQLATTAFVDAVRALLAPLASPALTGTPTAPTAAPGTNTTQIATMAAIVAERAAAASLSSKTLVAPTISGIATGDGATITTPYTITITANAGVIDQTKGVGEATHNANATLTFAGVPADGSWWSTLVKNSDATNPHTWTIPQSESDARAATVTTVVVPADGELMLNWYRDGTLNRLYANDGYLNNVVATTDPGVGNDVSQGYGPLSFWINQTGSKVWCCQDNAAGAAVWIDLTASGGSVTLSAITDMSADARTFNAAANNAAMRTALGVAIGTNVQAHSANLDEYAAVNPSAAGLAILDDNTGTDQLTTMAGAAPTGTGGVVREGSPALTGTPTAPTAAPGTSTTQLSTTAFVTAAVAAAVAGLLDFKGSIDASTNPNYPAGVIGDSYVISVAGLIGGASGEAVNIGDVVVCSADNAGGTEAAVGASWFVLEHNLQGALLSANNLSDVANAATALSNLGGAASGHTHTASGITDFAEAVDDRVGLDLLVLPTGAYDDSTGKIRIPFALPIACGDETTAPAAGAGLVTFHMPFDFQVVSVMGEVKTAQTSGSILTVDINEGAGAGPTILSTKITIDNTEETSLTAAAAPVISDAALAKGARVTVDLDQVGDGTARGLKVWLVGFITGF